MNAFDRRYEMMPRAELEQLQLERLQALLVRLAPQRPPLPREAGRPARRVAGRPRCACPSPRPEDMVESFPYGMFAFPLREVIRLHSTLGPDGKPLVIGHTRNDLAQWGRLVARQLVASGVTANDVIQICLGGWCSPAPRATCWAPNSSRPRSSPRTRSTSITSWRCCRTTAPTILITTPTNALELMRAIEQRRIDPQSLHLRTVLLSRPVDAETREQLAAGLFAAVHCNFGLGEILDPGLCVECEAGLFHVNEDQFLAEVCDGELVVTTLCREAMPLLRYRTRVAAELVPRQMRLRPHGRPAAARPAPRPPLPGQGNHRSTKPRSPRCSRRPAPPVTAFTSKPPIGNCSSPLNYPKACLPAPSRPRRTRDARLSPSSWPAWVWKPKSVGANRSPRLARPLAVTPPIILLSLAVSWQSAVRCVFGVRGTRPRCRCARVEGTLGTGILPCVIPFLSRDTPTRQMAPGSHKHS